MMSRQEKPEDVDTLSKRLGISRSFLAKILQALAREKILISYKGAKGGFALNKPPSEISMKHVIEVVEKKPITVFECSPSTDHCPNNRGEFCMVWPFLHRFQMKIDEFLDEMTLQDIL